MKPFVGSIWNTQCKKSSRKVVVNFLPNSTFQLGGDHRGLAGGIQQRWIPTIRAPLNQLSYVTNMF